MNAKTRQQPRRKTAMTVPAALTQANPMTTPISDVAAEKSVVVEAADAPIIPAEQAAPAVDHVHNLQPGTSPLTGPYETTNFGKDSTMATAFETTQDNVKSTVAHMNTSAEAALENSKAAMEQMTAKSREAIETSMKSMDEMADMARGNVEAVIASARAATTGLEQVAAHVTEASRKSFEEMTTIAKSMAAAKTPNELMQLQSDFAKTQFDGVVAEFSKMTEMMMKISGDIFEPMQNRMAISADKMKTFIATK